MPFKAQTQENGRTILPRRSVRDTTRKCGLSTPHMPLLPIVQRAEQAPHSLSRHEALQLQRMLGNQAIGWLLAHGTETAGTPKLGESVPASHGLPRTIQMQEAFELQEEETQKKADPRVFRRQEIEDQEEVLQGRFAASKTPIQLRGGAGEAANRTGMPDRLKAGLEEVSGMDLSGVRVRYNSSKPARLNASAYTQGQDIYVGPGQEKHLPHEGWHVVQQMQGRVKPTMKAEGLAINDNTDLEREADAMGAEASQRASREGATQLKMSSKALGLQSSIVAQRDPDDKAVPELSSLESIFRREHEVIRFGVGARALNKLAKGVVFYRDEGLTAVGLSETEFYAGPLMSDMGNIYYVFRITEASNEKEIYSVARSLSLHGWSPVTSSDVQNKIAAGRGAETILRFKTTPLLPTLSAEGGKTDDMDGERVDTTAKPSSEPEPVLMTPARRKWLKAGRGNMKNEIVSLFSSIQKLKEARLIPWERNTTIKDPKPLRDALEVSVAVLGYGFGGVIGGRLTKGMAHGIIADFIEESAVKATDKAVTAVFKHAVKPAKDLLSSATKKGLEESGKDSANAALASKGSLIDAYVESARLQSLVEERVQTREFNATVDAEHTDLSLADTVSVLQKVYDELLSEPSVFLRELTIGLVRLLDEVHLEKRAREEYGGDRNRLLEKDDTIHETDTRRGNIRLVGPLGGIGDWRSPNFGIRLNGQATGANTATLSELNGTAVKDLPLTLAFRLWASNPNRGILGDVFAKVWFTRRPNGVIWVDFDESGSGASVDNGLEWLARYHLNTSKDLSETERNDAAPKGARKVYDKIKEIKVSNVSNIDIF